MKQIIKKILDFFIGGLARRIGYIKPENSIQHKNELINRFISLMTVTGFSPKYVLDIGANRGTWTKEFIGHFPTAQFDLFEPQKWLFEESALSEIEKKQCNFYPIALSDETGTFSFTINGERDDSSSLVIDDQIAEENGWKTIECEVTTIDEFLKHHNKPAPDIIKIDAEGNDLKVLQGARNTLGKSEVVLVEVAIGNFDMENTAQLVTNEMDKLGYRLFEITDLNRPYRREVLWLCEFAFVLKGGKIDTFYHDIENIKIQ